MKHLNVCFLLNFKVRVSSPVQRIGYSDVFRQKTGIVLYQQKTQHRYLWHMGMVTEGGRLGIA